MPCKALVVLIAIAMIGTSSVALARSGGGGGGGMSGGKHSGHVHFIHRFHNNPNFFGGWGWGWGGYGGSGYDNTTVVAFPQATPKTADVTGSTRAAPCRWTEDTFTVPASVGGSRPVTVVTCR